MALLKSSITLSKQKPSGYFSYGAICGAIHCVLSLLPCAFALLLSKSALTQSETNLHKDPKSCCQLHLVQYTFSLRAAQIPF